MIVWLLLRMTLFSCDTLLLCYQKSCKHFKNKTVKEQKNTVIKGRYIIEYLKLHGKTSLRVRSYYTQISLGINSIETFLCDNIFTGYGLTVG